MDFRRLRALSPAPDVLRISEAMIREMRAEKRGDVPRGGSLHPTMRHDAQIRSIRLAVHLAWRLGNAWAAAQFHLGPAPRPPVSSSQAKSGPAGHGQNVW